MSDNIGKELSAPIPKECISERKGLSYVSGRYVKQRLNEVFGWDGWEYQVTEFKIVDNWRAFAHVHLRVYTSGPDKHGFRDSVCRDGVALGHGTSKTYQGQPLSEGRSNEVLDFACAEAVTDALKRAAVSLGQNLGLELYPMTAGGKAPAKKKVTKKAAPAEEPDVEW